MTRSAFLILIEQAIGSRFHGWQAHEEELTAQDIADVAGELHCLFAQAWRSLPATIANPALHLEEPL